MLLEAAMSHTFAQRPDTAADVASAAEELATQVCRGAYIQEKKCFMKLENTGLAQSHLYGAEN